MPEDPELATIRLTDLAYFESITARLPTEDESTGPNQIPRDLPVLVLHFRSGRQQVYRSDQIKFTIAAEPVPDPDTTRAESVKVLDLVIEAMENRMYDLQRLRDGLNDSPGQIGELAAELAELAEPAEAARQAAEQAAEH